MYFSVVESPVGNILLKSDGISLCGLEFSPFEYPVENITNNLPLFDLVKDQLRGYFKGEIQTFTVPLNFQGTPFQLKVWREVQRIPYGTTLTYMQLAERVGDVKAIRAVGRANGQNPIPILIPCHRVIGSNGKLIGYGGGIERKLFLLELESGGLFQQSI